MMQPQLIGDRYELQDRIGVGGMAQVFRARDRILGREVAVKLLHEHTATDPSFVARFRREARAAAALNHPNIVSIYDWGTYGESYYMVMEYVRGPNLKEVLRDGPLPEAEALGFTEQISQALEVAHRAGVIHRDVKPHNVLVAPGRRIKVVDFGIARATGLTQLTRTSAVIGTAHYISPEQARGAELDGRSDLYSLGVVLYEMLTGKEPFQGDSLVEVALQHAHNAPRPPRQINPAISPRTEAVVLRALAKEPGERYQTARELRDALEQARKALAVPAEQEHKTVLAPVPVEAEPTTLAPRPAPGAAIPPAERRAVSAGMRRRSPPAWVMAVPALLILMVAAAALALAHGSGPAKKSAQSARTSTPLTVKPPKTRGGRTSGSSGSRGAANPVPAGVPAVPTRPAGPTFTPAPVTPIPATTVPTISATASVAAAGADTSAARGAVQAFYGAVSSGDFSSACNLWSPDMQMRHSCQGEINHRFAGTRAMTLLGSSVAPVGNNTVTVGVRVRETTRYGNACTWSGSWQVVREPNGQWLLDNPTFGSCA